MARRKRFPLAQNKGREINYRPPGPSVGGFFASSASVRVILGPFGSGKSVACCMEIMRRARQQKPNSMGIRKTRWAVIRNTYPELKLTTLKTWFDWFDESMGPYHASPPYQHTLQFQLEDKTWVDAEVIFLALDSVDDVKKLLSLEVTGAYLNELREIPKSIIDALHGGRIGRYPSMAEGGPTWYGIIADTNMPDTDHWLHDMCEEEKPQGWDFFKQPPAVQKVDGKWLQSETAENIQNLVPGFYQNGLTGKSEEWIRVYYGCEYGFVLDGKPVYPEYFDSQHCSADVINPDKSLPLFVGIDFGLTPAAVFAQRYPNGRWVWVDEIVTEDMGVVRFGEALGRKLRGEYAGFKIGGIYGDPAGEQRSQVDERTPFEALAGVGVAARPAPSNDFIKRREAVSIPLTRMIDGKAGLILSPACKILRKAMRGGYKYRRVMVQGKERSTDVPDKNNFSHVAEAGQYLMLGAGEGLSTLRGGTKPKPTVAKSEWNPLHV